MSLISLYRTSTILKLLFIGLILFAVRQQKLVNVFYVCLVTFLVLHVEGEFCFIWARVVR